MCKQTSWLANVITVVPLEPDDPVELALARIRQLAAHEVGHTLGLSHNFAASTYGRESVMDYPAPLVTTMSTGSSTVSVTIPRTNSTPSSSASTMSPMHSLIP